MKPDVVCFVCHCFLVNIASTAAHRAVISLSSFSGTVGAFAGGIVPEVAKVLTGQKFRRDRWRDVLLVCLYFAWMGVTVDVMYTWFGHVYGADHAVATILKKNAKRFVFQRRR